MTGFQLDLQNNTIFLGTSNDIIRVDLDGSNPQVLVPNVSNLVELDLDLATGSMYWMTTVGIFSANLDGLNVQEILPVGPLATLGKDDMIIISTSAVPEPSSLVIGLTGALLLIGYGCWRRPT